MTSENSSADGPPAPGVEPGAEVPEADAAEQRTTAHGEGEGWDAPSEESFDHADEADVVEQAFEVGTDDDERR
ncbi:hypothetical protein Q8791_15470 [Nocardiopsis sp. CT-R113]|uniref:Uncharacterized protein n=1 Tax=Nocardiopsis codii TaxID=3065942 RepID=A0ABU7K9Q1_9ACTN|nr:hypothetical protein [Nocardiopsis sp. CT-R113]MEE2038624.1 hypothetical protein [Nocardiopsis sp. CT-R113]